MKGCHLLIFVLIICGVNVSATNSSLPPQPVRIGVVGSMVDSIGKVLLSVVDGLKVAVWEANMKGGVGGRQIEVIEANTNDNEMLVPSILDSLMANESTKLDVLALTPGRAHIDAVRSQLKRHNLLLVCPVSGDRQDFSYFDERMAIFSPIPDAEVEALIRYLVLEKKVKRIALATTREGVFGNDLIPYISGLLAEFGLEIVYHFLIDNPTKTFDVATKSPLQQIAEATPVKPQALLLLGYLYPVTGEFLAQYALAFYSQSYIAVPGLLFILAHQTFGMLPATFINEGYVVATQYTPLSTETSYRFVRNLRASYELAKSTLRSTIETFDNDATISPFFSSGYLVGRVIINVLKSVGSNGITSDSIQQEFFSSRVFHVDDWQFGPFSNSTCDSGVHDTTCECNAGARRVLLSKMTKQLMLIPIPSSTVHFSLDECIQSKGIKSPLIQLLPFASSSGLPTEVQAQVNASVEGFILGDRAGYINISTSPSSRTGIVMKLPFESISELQKAQEDNLLTVSVGGVFAQDVASAANNLTVLLDPLYLTPQLYSGYVPRVVYISATLDQEIHVIASLYGATGITVMTSDSQTFADALSQVFIKSLHTFGYTSLNVQRVSSIKVGLQAQRSGTIFVHGIATEVDLTEIDAYLGRHVDANIILPFQHLTFWYDALLRIISVPARRSRVLFATNIPDWRESLPITSPLLKSYVATMQASGVATSPRSLLGFLTQRLVANIVERIPSKLTQDTFLSTLFSVSVIVLDADVFTVGPLSNVACGGLTPMGSCEINVGARALQVRSLNLSPASSVVGSFLFTSGVIDYRSLPPEAGVDMTVILIGAVGGGMIALLVAIVVSILLCTGRSHRCAPKDPEKPFTIIFTDIQSSTSLWAEVPEEMALALEIHHRLIRALIKKHSGYEVKTIGDAFMVAFKYADDAVRLAFDLQHTFYHCTEFPTAIDRAYLSFDKEKMMEGAPESPYLSANLSEEEYDQMWSGLRVRVGIHTAFGDIKMDKVTKAYDYYGTVTNTAARVESVAHGGQVCFTEGTLQDLSSVQIQTFSTKTYEGIPETSPAVALQMGPVELRGLTDKVTLYQLECIYGRQYPPLRLDIEPEEDMLEESMSSTVNTLSEHPASQSASDSIAPASTPQDLHATQFMASIATLFSSMPIQKRNKEIKKLCELWRVRIDKKAIEKAKTWTSMGLRVRYGLRTVPEEAVNKCLALHIAKEDPMLAVCLEALGRRVKIIAAKTLSNAVTCLQMETDQVQIGKPVHSRKESIALDLNSQYGIRPMTELLAAPVDFSFQKRKSFDSGTPSVLVSPTSMMENNSPVIGTISKPAACAQRLEGAKTPLSDDMV